MKLNFAKVAAQGELFITKVSSIPKKLGTKVEPVNGLLIVGHSETGHHHVVDGDVCVLTRLDEFTSYLQVNAPTEVKHLREHDTHPSIGLQEGMYEFRTGREFDPFEETIRASRD